MKPNLPIATRAARLNSRGFTMMELMISLVVISIGVFSLTALIPAGTRSNVKAGQQTRGSELASITMERLLATPYTDADLDAGIHNDPANPYTGGYFVSWNVEFDQPVPNCKRLKVTTRWPTASAKNRVTLVGVNPRANDQ